MFVNVLVNVLDEDAGARCDTTVVGNNSETNTSEVHRATSAVSCGE